MEIGNIEVFLEAVEIGSARNKVLHKKFIKPETIGLIPAEGYTANNRYNKKALMSLLQTLASIEQKKRAGYHVKIQWEFKFDEADCGTKTRIALYGGRPAAMRLHYKISQGKETVQYCDVMSLYTYIYISKSL
jgi:hypothetical protein